jgi:hypothetical protein
MEQDHVPPQDDQESMVLHPSGNSVSSMNLHNEVIQPGHIDLNLALGLVDGSLQLYQVHNDVIQIVMVVHGPLLPPEMKWDSLSQFILTYLLDAYLPAPILFAPLASFNTAVLANFSWSVAFDGGGYFLISVLGKSQESFSASVKKGVMLLKH